MKKLIASCDICGISEEAKLAINGMYESTIGHCSQVGLDVCRPCHRELHGLIDPLIDEYEKRVQDVVKDMQKRHGTDSGKVVTLKRKE